MKRIFFFLFLMNMIRTIDNGIMPAIATTLKDDDGMSDVEVGSLGSFVYVGEVLGSILAIPIYKKIPVKLILLSTIVLQSIVLMVFVFADGNYRIMVISRFFTGIFQVFITILGPIWCDSYAPADKKTTWITWFIVATPVGIVLGYLKTAVILSQESNWAYGFYC